MTAPLGSVTVPLTDPVMVWAKPAVLKQSTTDRRQRSLLMDLVMKSLLVLAKAMYAVYAEAKRLLIVEIPRFLSKWT
jgi:hypothetical protein